MEISNMLVETGIDSGAGECEHISSYCNVYFKVESPSVKLYSYKSMSALMQKLAKNSHQAMNLKYYCIST